MIGIKLQKGIKLCGLACIYLKWRNFGAKQIFKPNFCAYFCYFGTQNFHFAPSAPNFLCTKISPFKVSKIIICRDLIQQKTLSKKSAKNWQTIHYNFFCYFGRSLLNIYFGLLHIQFNGKFADFFQDFCFLVKKYYGLLVFSLCGQVFFQDLMTFALTKFVKRAKFNTNKILSLYGQVFFLSTDRYFFKKFCQDLDIWPILQNLLILIPTKFHLPQYVYTIF